MFNRTADGRIFTGRRIFGIVSAVVLGLSTLILTPLLVENLDASEVMVIQSPISGELTTYIEPGWKFQGLGTVTKYPRRAEYKFGDSAECKSGLSIRFYDGGHATVCGSVSWEMPLDEKNIIAIHKAFRSAEGIEQQAINRSIESAAYFSGPTMSSLESAAGRRNELLTIINDQMINGVYKTVSKTVEHVDPITNVRRQVTATEIVMKDGQPVRAQESYVSAFNIKMLPLTVSKLAYDPAVEKQITDQQMAINQVQVAAANAKRAEQDAITATKVGEANAAKAKWEQEVINAKIIAEAEQKVIVAKAELQQADLFKKSEILRGEGEATRKRLVMEADGALEKKLEAFIEVNKWYADAIKGYGGAWVPSVVMGSSAGGTSASGAQQMIDMLTAKTAKDLSLDLSVKGTKK
jgi:hypothetical protein